MSSPVITTQAVRVGGRGVMKFKKSRHNSVVEASLYTNDCFDEFRAQGEGTTKPKTNNANVYND